jgi:DNA-binding transcriptional regulator GbsR (MarR family)
MQLIGGRMIARKEHVMRPFEYRAVGGDDDSMGWTRLEVVEPPHIESLELTLHPPAYTDWNPTLTGKYIRALQGTHVAVRGTSTKPLRSATLVREHGEEITMAVSDDGYSFALSADAESPWTIDRSEKYHFRLHDDGELPGGVESQWDIRAIEDHPPGVSIEKPAANVYVTAKATVPLKIVVREDLLVSTISLHFSRSDRSEEDDIVVSLYRRVESAETPQPQTAGNGHGSAQGDTQRVVHEWDIAALGLEPGAQMTFFATASDYKPQSGQSSSRRLTIITPHELENRIAERQSFILGELARVAKMQRDARSKTLDLQTQLADVGDLRKADIDQLRSAELVQRQVTRSLTSPSEGLKSQIDHLLDELRMNRLDSPQIERRMRLLREDITRIARENLPAAERDLTASLKAAQASLSAGKQPQAVESPLRQAGIQQDKIIRSLEAMLGDLSRFDQYRKIYRDVGQMRRDQAEAERLAAELGRGTKENEFKDATIGNDFNDLTPQQQTDLKKLGQGQADLARRFEKALQEMKGAISSLGERDPLAADSVSDAVHLARERGIASAMRRASGQIDRNQVAQATGAQRQAGQALQDMLDILQNRRESELNRLVKKLREAEDRLRDLRKRQKGLRKKMKEAAANPNAEERKRQLQRLAKEQKQLEEETRRLARQLMRLRAEKTGGQMARAAGKMSQAGQAGQQGDDGGAQQQADAAQKDLDEAQQQLAKRRRQAEIDLAMEQLARLEDALKSLHVRQKKLAGDTAQLNVDRGDLERLPRLLAGEVHDLANQQRALHAETAAQAEKLKAAATFQLVLGGAAGDMQRATARLDRKRTGQPTQDAQQNALARIARILDAFKQEKEDAKKKDDQQGGDSGGNRPAGQVRSLAEVRLIKLMQEDVNQRTAAIEKARGKTDPLTAEQDEEYDQLSREQSQLADLILDLFQPSEEDPENNPELLPDLGKELEKDGGLLPLELDLEGK